jgi:hypothetical protein
VCARAALRTRLAPERLALEEHTRHDVCLAGLKNLRGGLVRARYQPADLVVDVAGRLL